jgi:hypothetical protein
MLKFFRYKKIISGLALLTLFLFGATGSAFAAFSDQRISYKTKLRDDLDGDHIPETATIRQRGPVYQVVIHFTTGRPKLRLRTFVTGDIGGLTFATADLNHRDGGDLLILSATSLRPVAVWLNQGQGRFQRVTPWRYGLAGNVTGPGIKSRSEDQPAPVGNLLNSSLQADTTDSLHIGIGAGFLITPQCGLSDFEPFRRQIRPRGPPTVTHA